ncbi:hypothetical protein ACIQZI_16315 [Peribacillus sp. NPDC096379]|uniref:hypothetical protein n=1 Tax=Peribacillus sp. NPDC096379 TaxID=3364393 RepID=UPI00380F8D4A
MTFIQEIGVFCMLVAAVVIQYAPHAKTDIREMGSDPKGHRIVEISPIKLSELLYYLDRLL